MPAASALLASECTETRALVHRKMHHCTTPRYYSVASSEGFSLRRSHSRLEAENAALRQQLIVPQRKVRARVQFDNGDRRADMPAHAHSRPMTREAIGGEDW
jgi:hypothetical protein